MKDINEIKDMTNEDIEDFDLSSDVTYEVWAIGYDSDSRITDADMLIGEFKDPDKAVEKAKTVTLADIIHQAHEEDTGEEPKNDVAYLSIEVETVVDDDDDGTMNIGTIYKRELWIDGEYGDDANLPSYGDFHQFVPLADGEYTLKENGNIEVPCELLADYNKNDYVQIQYSSEQGQPILTYKIISKTTAGNYECEFQY